MRRLIAGLVCALVPLAAPGHAGSQGTDAPLPFEMPSAGELRSAGRPVYAHYIPTFPISIDNRPDTEDYYTTGYLAADGENGKHLDYGGYLRARPLPRPVDPEPDWALRDMRMEVQTAIQAGFDGFVVDLFGLEGNNWERVVLLLQAAQDVDPAFDIVLAPGANTGVVDDPDVLADAVVQLANYPTAARDASGRLVVAPFLAEEVGADYWQDWIVSMEQRGVEVAFLPILLDYTRSIDDFADLSVGVAAWGSRSVAGVESLAAMGEDADDRDLGWMQPVAMQDSRPKDGVFDEAGNTATLRAMWATAQEVDAEWVDVVSWNDYSEATQFAPSTSAGWSLLDINAYYLVAFKTGAAPPIVRDRIFVSHRIHPVGARPTGGQSQLMELRPGSSPARDEVEVLSFLREGATIDVTVGAQTYTYDAPAGVHAEVFPLAPGTISVTSQAADGYVASVTSPHAVTATPVVQDLEYRVAGSGRDGEHVVGPPPPTTTAPPPTSAPAPGGGTAAPSVAASETVDSAPVTNPDGSGSTPADDDGPGAWIAAGAVTVVVGAIGTAVLVRRSGGRRSSAGRPDGDVA